MDDYDKSQREIKNIVKIIKDVFDVDCEFLNKDIICEADVSDNFRDNRLIFEDVDGNPLQLSQLANLDYEMASKCLNASEIRQYRSIFNILYVKPLVARVYNRDYIKRVLNEKCYKGDVNSHICLLDGKFELRGITTSNRENHMKVLKIQRHSKCVIKSSNKLKISELLKESRFKDKRVEATYIFPCGEFSVKWENCFNIFDWPDLNADCHIKIKLRPDTMKSSLTHVKSELQHLKTLLDAIENDMSCWSLHDSVLEGLTVDQFKTQLPFLLANKVMPDQKENTPFDDVKRAYQRETDISEDLWTLFRNISSKSVYKQCIGAMMPILHDNVLKVKLNPANKTQFYRMLKEKYMKSEHKAVSFMTSLDLLIEIGLHKVAKDVIAFISEELPDLLQVELSELFTQCCLVDDLAKCIDYVNNLYNCVLFLEILKDLMNPPDFKKIAIIQVRKFMSANCDFDLQQNLTLKMMSVNRKLRSLSAVWVIEFVATEPFYSEKAVILEIERHEEEVDIYRHDIDVAEVPIFP